MPTLAVFQLYCGNWKF